MLKTRKATVSNQRETNMKDTSEHLLQTVTLLQRQRKLAEQVVRSGTLSLQNFEIAVDKGEKAIENTLEVMNYAFSLIDSLVRFQKIAGYIPQINHRKSKECIALRAGMANLKDVRNQHQHLQNHILNNMPGPILGTVSWISQGGNYTATYQDIGRTRSFPTIVYDLKERKYIHDFCYIYGDVYHDLKKGISAMRDFSDYIRSIVKIELNGIQMETDDLVIAMRTQMAIKGPSRTVAE
jgi:hypothetical protein